MTEKINETTTSTTKSVDWWAIIWQILMAIPWASILSAIFESFKPKLEEKAADPKSKISKVDVEALTGLNNRLLKGKDA